MTNHNPDLPAVVKDLEQLRSAAQKCVSEIEGAENQCFTGSDEDKVAWEQTWYARENASRDYLANLISALSVRVAIYSDAMRIPSAGRLLRQWRKRWPENGWRETKSWSIPEADGIFSEPLAALDPIIDGILVLARPSDAPPLDTAQRRSHELLEHALRSTAKLCRDRGVVPKKEADVQNVMHSHLEGIFRDYTRTVTISKPLVSFKPDGGVTSLKSAIECKFIASEADLREAVHGLTEDLAGYAGSADWTRFYTLCYMTAAFAVEGQLEAALGASGMAGSWKVIMVTGSGGRE